VLKLIKFPFVAASAKGLILNFFTYFRPDVGDHELQEAKQKRISSWLVLSVSGMLFTMRPSKKDSLTINSFTNISRRGPA
jgi:hypothetical protein